MSAVVKKPSRKAPRAKELANRFAKFNRQRLGRMLASLGNRQREFVELIPLLFHVNHPLLPGYISKDLPVGIADYVPTRNVIKIAQKITIAFHYEHRLVKIFPIQGLFLMGSPGTIAYSKHSDLDMWLCFNPALSEEELLLLDQKAKKIEKYAAGLALEVHFFILSAESFRNGNTLSLSDESSGSSQHALLLDEFYRSALHLAGLHPIWWCVPSNEEHRYNEFVCELVAEEPSFQRDYIDFGGLTGVPASEFFGAGVWQLYKSIDSPFKSVLKLLLIESYVVEYPSIELLSNRYKNLIEQAATTLNDLDPYVLMYRKVDEFLKSAGDESRRELLRRCFYLKINLQLSKLNKSAHDWRSSLLSDLTRLWNWSARELEYLDNRQQWRIIEATEERKSVVSALNTSYLQLSNFARNCGEDQQISRTDLNTLARKLYAAFERKPSKVEIVTRGICKYPIEKNLSISWYATGESTGIWNLHAERLAFNGIPKTKAIKSSDSLSRLLTWCHFNHLYDNKTAWQIAAPELKLQQSDVARVIAKIAEVFPDGLIESLGNESLSANVQPHRILMIVNFGQTPLQGRLNQNVLTTNNNDAFKYGGQKINLIQSAAIIYMTSWEEVYVRNFKGPLAVHETMLELVQLSSDCKAFNPHQFHVFAACRDYSLAIQTSVEHHSAALTRFLRTNRHAANKKYISQVEGGFCAYSFRNGASKLTHYATQHTLLKSLSAANESYLVIGVDPQATDCSLLKTLYEESTENTVSFFIYQRQAKADIYIIDEKGSLFVQRRPSHQIIFTISQFQQFFDSIFTRQQLAHAKNTSEETKVIKTFVLSDDKNGGMHADPFEGSELHVEGQIPVRVFVDSDSTGQQVLNILVDEVEFSAAKLGDEFFPAIARSILAKRKNQSHYPIYINDLEFSRGYQSSHDIEAVQTVHLLNFKKRIEYQMSRSLVKVSAK